DANGCSVIATAEILPGDCIPVARDDNFRLSQGVLFEGDVSVNDNDPNTDVLTFVKLTDPESGKLSFNPDGSFDFMPERDFIGTVTFSYQICNTSGGCD